jgi:hypothetical protein
MLSEDDAQQGVPSQAAKPTALGTAADRGESKRRRGRPGDTDVREDRRIAEAWKTGEHESLEALAHALGKSKPEVKNALDRHRHRVGKNRSPKSCQGDRFFPSPEFTPVSPWKYWAFGDRATE